ncbi:MAG: Gfo/Idh/MocA family oxidoreductase [Candidatus Omnitrophica bacterium]|nr:Gfo/Idh/MocA family oxidoreductase [Candidatus Omnitrophota bacterium]MCM8823407.1 Gfo/Idh/MocA family oxidoreductase [Candidatus Omnitrophota bacterium]MCM8826358.1 Gfo/Idh/MocA family oxidoreductase [Candidatus Omnitrophota bacterium]
MKLNVGIIGLGNIGNIHYKIYKQIKNINKIYVVDIDYSKIANLEGEKFTHYKDILGKINLVSIATPTSTHFEIAKFFLSNGINTFVEKPLTNNIKEAKELLSIAQKKRVLLFVGHVERYNSAYLAIKKIIQKPKFIECHRLSIFPYRSLDISVVLDLMIHDLDIILDIVKDKVKKIEAKGVNVLSSTTDIANARITFEKGCVANITSSRISAKKERKIRVFIPNCYVSLDYAEQKVEIYRKCKNRIIKETIPIKKGEPLKREITDFIKMVKTKHFSLYIAHKALKALELALNVQRIIEKDN